MSAASAGVRPRGSGLPAGCSLPGPRAPLLRRLSLLVPGTPTGDSSDQYRNKRCSRAATRFDDKAANDLGFVRPAPINTIISVVAVFS